jgi:hypothetical protein
MEDVWDQELGSGGSPPKMYEIRTLEGVLKIVLNVNATQWWLIGVY